MISANEPIKSIIQVWKNEDRRRKMSEFAFVLFVFNFLQFRKENI